MSTQTMFDASVARTPTLAERLADTPLDPARGRAREFRVIFALTFTVLLMLFALARLVPTGRRGGGARRSIVQEARSAALSALPYAYRY